MGKQVRIDRAGHMIEVAARGLTLAQNEQFIWALGAIGLRPYGDSTGTLAFTPDVETPDADAEGAVDALLVRYHADNGCTCKDCQEERGFVTAARAELAGGDARRVELVELRAAWRQACAHVHTALTLLRDENNWFPKAQGITTTDMLIENVRNAMVLLECFADDPGCEHYQGALADMTAKYHAIRRLPDDPEPVVEKVRLWSKAHRATRGTTYICDDCGCIWRYGPGAEVPPAVCGCGAQFSEPRPLSAEGEEDEDEG